MYYIINTVHQGQAQDLFLPYHVSLKAASPSELQDSVILDKIGFSAGTKSHLTERRENVGMYATTLWDGI